MKKIVCLGDSLTRGFNVPEKESWVGLLKEKHGWNTINKGVNGDTTSGMLARFQEDVIKEKPGYVLIAGGVNDLICGSPLGAIQANIMGMVHVAYRHGILPIVGTCLLGDEGNFRKDWNDMADIGEINALNRAYRCWILKLSAVFHVPCLDLQKEYPLRAGIRYGMTLTDGLHPSREGHELMASIADEFLKAHCA